MDRTGAPGSAEGITLPPLIRALLSPQRYGGALEHVTLVQTHISWVLLAGGFAYKIKKPVKLTFLDFSTLALRKRFCEDELRLNRRFSSDIYLDVVALYGTAANPQWQGSGPPLEYAVRMRRFAQTDLLDQVCARGALTPAHLSDLACTVAAFHQAAVVAPPDSPYGSDASVMQQALENFDDLLKMTPSPAVQQRLQALRRWTLAQHSALASLIASRKQIGFVRECHGDLHLTNLVLLEDKVHMFDCIEFNADLRWIDVASELAFTYVDLLAHHQPGLATWFVNQALSASGDYACAPLLRFYAVYRALVRAKVTLIQATQNGADHADALAYVALAEQLAAPPLPQLLITHGESGCGKTWETDQLLQHDTTASTLRLRTDVERKRLAGLAAQAHTCSTLNAGLYGAGANTQTYARLRERAAALLRARWSVIVDGTFLHRAQRDLFHTLAQESGVRFAILAPQATPEQLRTRVARRSAQGSDASEATLEVLSQQLALCEPLAADEARYAGTATRLSHC